MKRTPAEEAERAAFYEAHKNDEDIWSEPIEPPVSEPRKGLDATITVRFSAEEAAHIRRVARERHITYSQVVREAVREFTQPRIAFTIQASKKPLQIPVHELYRPGFAHA